MTLGRSSSGAIKIKTDEEGGGLRAVECACCGANACCFYHTQALANGIYTVADLPDEIIYKNPFGEPLTLFKGVWSYGEYTRAAIPGAYFGRPEPELEDSVLYYGEDSFFEGWAKAQLDSSPGSCLIADVFSDTFASSYQITGLISGTVTRSSLCTWETAGLLLKYDGSVGGFGDPGDPAIGSFKWQINGNNKSGFQNTPVGSYAGGYTVS